VSARGCILLAVLCVMIAAVPCGLSAQEHQPQPYSPDEFQGWMKDLYRAEVVFFGSLPLTLFLSLESYDLYRYFNTGLDPTYAPWPFNTGNTINLSTREAGFVIATSVGLSLSVAVLDFMIGRWNATSKKS
jgi:hypothetical protein